MLQKYFNTQLKVVFLPNAFLSLNSTHLPFCMSLCSSNFTQPCELLKFLPCTLTLDVQSNPVDWDPDGWRLSVRTLNPNCFLLLEGFTNPMLDNVSNMRPPGRASTLRNISQMKFCMQHTLLLVVLKRLCHHNFVTKLP